MSNDGSSQLPVTRRGFLVGALAGALASYLPQPKREERRLALPDLSYRGPLIAVDSWRFSVRHQLADEWGGMLVGRSEWSYDLGVLVHASVGAQAVRQAQEALGRPMLIQTQQICDSTIIGTALLSEVDYRRSFRAGDWDRLALHFIGTGAPEQVAGHVPFRAVSDAAWLLEAKPAPRELRRAELVRALGATP